MNRFCGVNEFDEVDEFNEALATVGGQVYEEQRPMMAVLFSRKCGFRF
jgi:hypothetical protein